MAVTNDSDEAKKYFKVDDLNTNIVLLKDLSRKLLTSLQTYVSRVKDIEDTIDTYNTNARSARTPLLSLTDEALLIFNKIKKNIKRAQTLRNVSTMEESKAYLRFDEPYERISANKIYKILLKDLTSTDDDNMMSVLTNFSSEITTKSAYLSEKTDEIEYENSILEIEINIITDNDTYTSASDAKRQRRYSKSYEYNKKYTETINSDNTINEKIANENLYKILNSVRSSYKGLILPDHAQFLNVLNNTIVQPQQEWKRDVDVNDGSWIQDKGLTPINDISVISDSYKYFYGGDVTIKLIKNVSDKIIEFVQVFNRYNTELEKFKNSIYKLHELKQRYLYYNLYILIALSQNRMYCKINFLTPNMFRYYYRIILQIMNLVRIGNTYFNVYHYILINKIYTYFNTIKQRWYTNSANKTTAPDAYEREQHRLDSKIKKFIYLDDDIKKYPDIGPDDDSSGTSLTNVYNELVHYLIPTSFLQDKIRKNVFPLFDDCRLILDNWVLNEYSYVIISDNIYYHAGGDKPFMFESRENSTPDINTGDLPQSSDATLNILPWIIDNDIIFWVTYHDRPRLGQFGFDKSDPKDHFGYASRIISMIDKMLKKLIVNKIVSKLQFSYFDLYGSINQVTNVGRCGFIPYRIEKDQKNQLTVNTSDTDIRIQDLSDLTTYFNDIHYASEDNLNIRSFIDLGKIRNFGEVKNYIRVFAWTCEINNIKRNVRVYIPVIHDYIYDASQNNDFKNTIVKPIYDAISVQDPKIIENKYMAQYKHQKNLYDEVGSFAFVKWINQCVINGKKKRKSDFKSLMDIVNTANLNNEMDFFMDTYYQNNINGELSSPKLQDILGPFQQDNVMWFLIDFGRSVFGS
jgi:hypothetical protein